MFICEGSHWQRREQDIQEEFTAIGSHVWLWPCGASTAGKNEEWLSTGRTIRSVQPDTTACLGINATGHGRLALCSSVDAVLKMSGKAGGKITTGTGQCLGMAPPPPPPPPSAVQPWNDASLPLEERLDDLLARLTQKELISMLGGPDIGTIRRSNLTLPGISYGRECLSGVDSETIASNGTGTTAFPVFYRKMMILR